MCVQHLRILIIGAVFVAFATSANAQFSVSGTVTGPGAVPAVGVNLLLFDGIGNPIGIPPTVTNAVGFYAINGLPVGTYELGFEPPASTKLLPKNILGVVVSNNVTLNVALDPGLLLSGFVRDSTGVGIFNIDLKVEDDNTGAILNTPGDNTDLTGFYDVVVPAGEYNLTWRAVDPLVGPWISVEMQRVMISVDTVIDVTMILGVFVSGVVTDGNANPVPNVNLDFTDVATGIKLDTPGDNTDLTGFYEVHVPIATYDVGLKPRVIDKLVGLELLGVPVLGDTTVDAVLQAGVSLSGTVRNAALAPVANADLDAEFTDGAGEVFLPFDATDLLGHYEVIVLPGEYDLAYRPPLATILAPVSVRDVVISVDTVLDVMVPNGVVLSGVVTNNLAAPVVGVDIDVDDPLTGFGIPVLGDQTDATGAYSTVVAPGTYDVEFEPAKILKLVAQRLTNTNVTLNTTLNVSLNAGLSVHGTVTDLMGTPIFNVDVDARTTVGGNEIFTPADHSNAAGQYEIIIPVDSYSLIYKPDSLSGIPDSVLLENRVIVTDLIVDVQFPVIVPTGIGVDSPVFGAARLEQNYPNPFNPATTIGYTVVESGRINLAVYNVRGGLVNVLQSGVRQPGPYSVIWDGRDTRGVSVSTGVYFYRLQTNDRTITRKMILLK